MFSYLYLFLCCPGNIAFIRQMHTIHTVHLKNILLIAECKKNTYVYSFAKPQNISPVESFLPHLAIVCKEVTAPTFFKAPTPSPSLSPFF